MLCQQAVRLTQRKIAVSPDADLLVTRCVLHDLQGLISHAEIVERDVQEATPADHGFSSSPSRLQSSSSLEGWPLASSSS